MPEGDTVHTLAQALDSWLQGQRLTAVLVRGQVLHPVSGLQVMGVTSRGKHLFVDLEGGYSLRSHLGLYGSWHRYRHGEPWQKPPRRASLVLDIGDWVYVCFNAREVELMHTQGFRAIDQRHRLGPDLTRDVVEPERLLERALELLGADTPVVDLLLDQRVAAGIGNVYKSEVLFITRRPPLLRLGDLSHTNFCELYSIAGCLLKKNLGGGSRRTRWPDDGRGLLWVYGRAGLPCLTCGAPIRRDLLGRRPRSTYWCPGCQAHSP